ncbi:MAG: ribonuclease J [Microthrixaceae bacterium]
MASPLKITFLGGLGEIGRNCAAFEYEGKILLLDCGLMFPDHDMLGVDIVLPDFGWLVERADDVVGCVLTHGHEDHVGALSYLLPDISFPLYGTEVTLGLAHPRIEENGLLSRTEFHEVRDTETHQIGPFSCQFFAMTHSVPQGVATAITTDQGTLLHSGDFKIDLTPVDGRLSDLSGIGAIATDPGIRLLLADSTNADSPGFSVSETQVGKVLYDLMHRYRGRRIVTACFASHIHRVQQIASAAIEYDRKVATLGRSMKRNVAMAREMGVLSIPDDALIEIEEIDNYDPGEVIVISTGSQGEAMSALTLMATRESRWLNVGEGDVVILSSHPIPGNEHAVNKVIDNLTRLGVEVVHSGIEDVHATGHAKREELKLLQSLTHADWFVPVHGEYTHMVHHAKIAELMGMAADRILVCEDGDSLVLDDDGLRRGPGVPAEYVYVDGKTVGDIGHSVLRDRQVLAEEGVVSVVVAVDLDRREIVSGPELVTRGWVHEVESADLLEEGRKRVSQAVNESLMSGGNCDQVAKAARKAAGGFVNKRTRRRPIIVPVVLEA